MFGHGSASLLLFLVVRIFLRSLGCHLLRQMRVSKLLEGLVSHKLTAYLSIFNLFKFSELWSFYAKHVKQIILNCATLWWIFDAFLWMPSFLPLTPSFVFSVLSINPSANAFVFGVRTGLLILVELIDLVNSFIILMTKFQMTILRWLTFLLVSQTILTVLLFWIYLFLLTLVFVLQWLSLHWEILIMLLSQFPLNLHHICNGMPHFMA